MPNTAKITNFLSRETPTLTTTWAEAFTTASDRDGVYAYCPSGAGGNLCLRFIELGGTAPTTTVDLTGAVPARLPDAEVIPGQAAWFEVGANIRVFYAASAGTFVVDLRETA